jgi:hypothetical protein
MRKPRTEERLNAEIREFTGRIRKLRNELRASLHTPERPTADELPPRRRPAKKR